MRIIENEREALMECPDTIDHTAGSLLDECDRAYYYFVIRGLRPVYERDYFISGKAWDRALGRLNDSTLDKADRLTQARLAIRETWAHSKCEYVHENRAPDNLIHLLDLFIENYGFDHEYEILESNIYFRFPYKDFFIGGEIDAYIDWPGLGVIADENKTTNGVISDAYLAGFFLGGYANQLKTYNWACRQITENLWGNRVNIASLAIPKRKSTQRTLFQSLLIQPPEQEILDVLELYERRMGRLRENWKLWSWPKCGTHCEGGWGFSACDYRFICKISTRLGEEEVIPQQYRVADWRPWEGQKGDWEGLSSAEKAEIEERAGGSSAYEEDSD